MLQQPLRRVTPRLDRFVARGDVERWAASDGTPSDGRGSAITPPAIYRLRAPSPPRRLSVDEAELRGASRNRYYSAARCGDPFGRQRRFDTTSLECHPLHGLSSPSEARSEPVDAMTPADDRRCRAGDMARRAIFRPRSPDCPACPLRDDFPALSGPPNLSGSECYAGESARHDSPVDRRDGDLWLVRRPPNWMLGGWPRAGPEWTTRRRPSLAAPLPCPSRFSHFSSSCFGARRRSARRRCWSR